MILEEDVNKISTSLKLVDLNSSKNFGHLYVDISAQKYDKISNLKHQHGYFVSALIRTYIPNPKLQDKHIGQRFFESTQEESFSNYPILLSLSSQLKLNTASKFGSKILIDYFPRTLNSELSTTTSTNSGDSRSTATSHTSGSSNSTANSFGVNASIGFFGDMLTGGFGVDARTSNERGTHQSNTDSNDVSVQKGSSKSFAMSIKDWSSYSSVSNYGERVSWVWGQTYPWDIIQFNAVDNENKIKIPTYIEERLYSDEILNPPSQLALNGLDFVNSCKWQITFDDVQSLEDFKFRLQIEAESQFAEHHLVTKAGSKRVEALINESCKSTLQTEVFDICVVGLTYIPTATSHNGAVIGLDSDKPIFISTENSQGRILSNANNLLLDWEGFNKNLSANLSSNSNAKITLQFKIIDTIGQYSLALVHWLTQSNSPCNLKIKINDTYEIIETINNIEKQGGQNNQTEISLRNTNFDSNQYHDYLNLGLNKVEIEIIPENSNNTNLYKLFAVAII